MDNLKLDFAVFPLPSRAKGSSSLEYAVMYENVNHHRHLTALKFETLEHRRNRAKEIAKLLRKVLSGLQTDHNETICNLIYFYGPTSIASYLDDIVIRPRLKGFESYSEWYEDYCKRNAMQPEEPSKRYRGEIVWVQALIEEFVAESL